MSSQESREARSKRISRQAQGARDSLRFGKGHGSDRAEQDELNHGGPTQYARTKERWADDYTGTQAHDEEYFIEHELDFQDE